MTTIYVVTSGNYSDYGTNALFSSKERAQAYIDYQNTHLGYSRDYSIEEWTLDEFSTPIRRGLTCFRVWFSDITKGDARVEVFSASDESESAYQNPQTRIGNYVVWVWARDEQGAMKIANERRVQYLLRLEQQGEYVADAG